MLTNILNNIIKIIFFLFSAFLIVGYTLAILFADRDICDAKVEIHMYDKEHNPIRNCIFLLENTSYKGGTTEYRVKTNSKGYFKIFFEKVLLFQYTQAMKIRKVISIFILRKLLKKTLIVLFSTMNCE